jgi:hypothetical protein
MKIRRAGFRSFWVLLLVFVFAGFGFADPTKVKGVFDDWGQDNIIRGSGARAITLSEREMENLKSRISIIGEVFKKTSLRNPVGYDVTRMRNIDLNTPFGLHEQGKKTPVRGNVRLSMIPYEKTRDGSFVRSRTRILGAIYVYFNDPAPGKIWGAGCKTIDGETWYLEPKPIGKAGRFTIYEQTQDHRTGRRGQPRYVMLVSSGMPALWVPVTTEEFIIDRRKRIEMDLAEYRANMSRIKCPDEMYEHRRKTLIETYDALKKGWPGQAETYQEQLEAQLAVMEPPTDSDRERHKTMMDAAKTMHAGMEENIDGLNKLLNSMTQSERNAQFVGGINFTKPAGRRIPHIYLPGEPGNSEPRPVVRLNTAAFDQISSKTYIGVIVADFYTYGFGFTREYFDKLIHEVDWETIARILD